MSLLVVRFASTASLAASLGGVAPHGLGDGPCDDGLAQGGGVVCPRGGVDGGPSKVIALITPEDGSVEDGGGGFQRGHMVRVECWLDWLVLPARRWAAW